MQSKERVIIQKIIKYIDDVKEYTDNMTALEFLHDKKTMSACAFSVSQIGELAKETSDETQAKYDNIAWRAMMGMRNRIVHDYENVDSAVLWGTIEKSLPDLKTKLEIILFKERAAYDEYQLNKTINEGVLQVKFEEGEQEEKQKMIEAMRDSGLDDEAIEKVLKAREKNKGSENLLR